MNWEQAVWGGRHAVQPCELPRQAVHKAHQLQNRGPGDEVVVVVRLVTHDAAGPYQARTGAS